MKNRFVVLIGMLLSVFGALAVMDNTYATDGATIMKKWAFTQYYECVRNNINSPIEQKNSGIVPENVFPKSGELWLPSYKFQNNVNSGKVNCYDLFLGKASGLSFGILGYAGIDDNVNWSNPSGSQAFLEKLGYALENDGEQRFTIQASERTETEVYSIFGSTKHVSDRDAGSLVITVSDNDEGTKTYSYDGGFLGLNNAMSAIQVGFSDHKMKVAVDAGFLGAVSGCRNLYSNQEEWFPLKNDVQEFYNDLRSGLANKTWGYTCNDAYSGSKTTYSFVVDPDGTGIVNSGDAGRFVYAKDQNKYDVSDNVIKSMSGIDIRGLILDNNELYTLYYYYLEKSLPTGVANRITCNPSNTNNLTAINLKDVDGQVKTCYVNFNGVDPGSISVYTQSHTDLRNRQPYPFITAITMQDVINWFNSVDASTLTDVGVITDSNNESNNQEGANSGDVDACYNGAGVLGWIVCPITSGLAKVGSEAYKWIEENFLQIRSSIFSDDANGVRDAWGTIRNIANLGFIIMFLIVIFSQVTGIGIDNYGIKRILPKLIVGAIVMNLSYIICELAVDVSNIAGSGLKNLLSAMGPTLNAPTSGYNAGWEQYVIVGGTGVLAAAGIMILSSGGLGAILTLLIAVLSVVVSIIVLFVVLIVRQAGVVVCVVIAPIAILMYLLPNTEKFFKRWLDLMKGLLLVYPLCGLVIGAGDFIGKIFGNLANSSSGNLQMGFALSAMIVQAVPYLFIPTLLKSSLAAMGNLGAKISGFGSRLRGGATKRIQGSEAMKNSRERASEFRTRVKAGVDREGNDKHLGGFRSALRGGKRGMARARAQYLKNQDTRRRENDLMGAGFMAASAGMRAKVDESKVAAYDSLLDLGEATYKVRDEASDEEKTFSVNPNNAESVGKYHAWAIEQYERAGDNEEKKAEAMAQIKAAQNILSKTDKGRAAVQNNFEVAVQSGRAGAVPAAAAHIMGAYGDKYKSVNRGAHAMISDLSTGVDMNSVNQKIKDGTYDRTGTSKYTEESLAGADDEALDRLIKRIQSKGSDRLVDYTDADGKKHTPLSDIQHTAALALQKSQTGNLNVKPEVAEKLRIIAGAQAPASVATAEPVIADEGGTFSTREVNGSQTQPVVQQAAPVAGPQPQAAPVQSVEVPVRQQATGAAAQGSAIDLRALGDETLLDIATNPNAENGDTTRTAAEQEFLRRNPGFNSEVRGGAGADNTQPPKIPPQE